MRSGQPHCHGFRLPVPRPGDHHRCPPHGGFAIGLERLTQKVLGLANVKEACLFPRDRRRVRP
jgi:hypothetical protein